MPALLRRPAAWLPIAIAVVCMAMIAGYVAAFGVVRNADEGAPARVFQLLLVAQVVLIGSFAIRWLPRAPREAAAVLAIQLVAAVVPVLTILAIEG